MSFSRKVNAQFIKILSDKMVQRLGKPYVGGSSLGHGKRTVENYIKRGIFSTLDILGEAASSKRDADRYFKAYMDSIDLFSTVGKFGKHPQKCPVSLSVKPSSVCHILGTKPLTISSQTPLFNRYEKLVRKAKKFNMNVTIDMEDSPYTSATIELFQKLLRKGYDNVGIVLQSRLFRTKKDIKEIFSQKYKVPYSKIRVRHCIGIYTEPKEIATTSKKFAKRLLLRRIHELFEAGVYVEVATHDENIVREVLRYIRKKNIPNDQYEFQFLKGVPLSEKKVAPILVKKGKVVRAYMPIEISKGDGIPYMKRRLLANPWITFYGAKNFIQRLFIG